ncbi:hypothetical protein FRC11_008375 [Ceratobasidium sp. 423]|nr:hypothetical protein FRC11_008375 [Ceratobasidium sp. 423]
MDIVPSIWTWCFPRRVLSYHPEVHLTHPQNTTYEPPALPAHLSVQLEPISGVPSGEQIIKVQDALRSYQQFAGAKYMQRAKQNQSVSAPRDAPSLHYHKAIEEAVVTIEEERRATNNPGPEIDAIEPDRPMERAPDAGLQDAIVRSNRLAEQANQLAERSNLLIERSNQIAERANQLAERSNEPAEQSNNLVERFNELFSRLNGHFEQSNRLAEISAKRVEIFEEVLRTISRVLVGIQHAIVRNHRGNTYKAADCLVNEKGDMLGQSRATGYVSR